MTGKVSAVTIQASRRVPVTTTFYSGVTDNHDIPDEVSLHQRVCEETREHFITSDYRMQPSLQRKCGQSQRQKRLCSCCTQVDRKARSYYCSPSIDISCSSEATANHYEKCPLYTSSLRSAAVAVQVIWPGALLTFSTRFSVSLTRGAGWMSIMPSLIYHRLVTENSPTFRILRRETLVLKGALVLSGCESRPTQHLSAYFRSALTEILQHYRTREASPYDSLKAGTTLLMVSVSSALVADQFI